MNMINDQLAKVAEYQQQILNFYKQAEVERHREMERIRGIKPMRYRIPPFTAATSLLIRGIPVDQGYTWNLKMITGKLSANDSVAAYMGEDANGALLGYVGPPGAGPAQNVFQLTWTSSQGILYAGETVFLTTSGAGSLSNVTMYGIQVPAEMIGKIVS